MYRNKMYFLLICGTTQCVIIYFLENFHPVVNTGYAQGPYSYIFRKKYRKSTYIIIFVSSGSLFVYRVYSFTYFLECYI